VIDMKSETEIRKALRGITNELTEQPLARQYNFFVYRTLKWVLGEDDEFLDYLLRQ